MAHIWKKNYGDSRLTLQSLLNRKTINLYEQNSNGSSMSITRGDNNILLRVSPVDTYHVGSSRQCGVQFIVDTNNIISSIKKIIIPSGTTIKMSVDFSISYLSGFWFAVQWVLVNYFSSYSGSGYKPTINLEGVYTSDTLTNYMRTGNWCYSFYCKATQEAISVSEAVSFSGPTEIDTSNLDITNYFGIAFTWYGNDTTANIKINKSELEIDGKVYLE